MQDEIFKREEADRWFERNKEALVPKEDLIIKIIRDYRLLDKNSKVLEVGASNGYRLAKIHEEFGSKVFAIEPSKKAVEDGKSQWSFITFYQTTIAELEDNEHLLSFDLIIVNSVFHWIDRGSLLLSVAKIDRLLKWGGHLIVGDFQIPIPTKRSYHHKEGVFTYKQPYKDIFTASCIYVELYNVTFNHDGKRFTGIDMDTYFSISLLRKQEIHTLKT